MKLHCSLSLGNKIQPTPNQSTSIFCFNGLSLYSKVLRHDALSLLNDNNQEPNPYILNSLNF